MKLVIIDYGMGNVKSLSSVFKYLGVDDVLVSNNYNHIKAADKLILPGVGSFFIAMKRIIDFELDKTLKEVVLEEKKPILGICLGMQLLCNSSEEDGGSKGLGYVNAECKRFPQKKIKIPHVGFNQVISNRNTKLFKGLKQKNDFYFTHSYRLETNNDIRQSMCDHSEIFIASYEINNILGTQFHPELSQTNGIKLLKNFLEIF